MKKSLILFVLFSLLSCSNEIDNQTCEEYFIGHWVSLENPDAFIIFKENGTYETQETEGQVNNSNNYEIISDDGECTFVKMEMVTSASQNLFFFNFEIISKEENKFCWDLSGTTACLERQ